MLAGDLYGKCSTVEEFLAADERLAAVVGSEPIECDELGNTEPAVDVARRLREQLRADATQIAWQPHARAALRSAGILRSGPGRPPSRGEKATANVLIRVTDADRDRWQKAAKARGTTLSEAAREAWEALCH